MRLSEHEAQPMIMNFINLGHKLGKSIHIIPNIKQHKYYCDVRWEDEITEEGVFE